MTHPKPPTGISGKAAAPAAHAVGTGADLSELPPITAAALERRAAGKARRNLCSRAQLGRFTSDGRDGVAILEASNKTRLPELVPIRYGRMLHSPFSFYRGAAPLMAYDTGPLPSPQIRTQISGDCHLGNFGGFASPDRTLLFGLNDFDETTTGHFEWDLKRLAASFVVAAREQGVSDRDCIDIVMDLSRSYREKMSACARMKALDLWYSRIEVNTLVQLARTVESRRKRIQMAERARSHTSEHAYPKLVEIVDGKPRIRDHPPLIYHANDVPTFHHDVKRFWTGYVASMPEERRVLLARYQLVDVAIKVVGVGSVGTRCAIALLMAQDNDPLFLQFKEARASVFEPWSGASPFANQGQRVVIGQQLLQAASDIFLGWSHATHLDVDFYVRQLQDMKISLDFEDMSAEDFTEYAEACAWALARAHAKAGDPCVISGYLGKSEVIDRAITRFALNYAEQNEQDYEALQAAVKSGRVIADPDAEHLT